MKSNHKATGYKKPTAGAYWKFIAHLADKGENCAVPNGTPEHATALLANMLRVAHEEILVFSRALNEEVFADPRVLEPLREFLERPNVKMKILVQDDISDQVDNHGFLSAIQGRVPVRLAQGDFSRSGDSEENHFFVMDGKGFRLELDHDKCSAVANFNDTRIASYLKKKFCGAFESGRALLN